MNPKHAFSLMLAFPLLLGLPAHGQVKIDKPEAAFFQFKADPRTNRPGQLIQLDDKLVVYTLVGQKNVFKGTPEEVQILQIERISKDTLKYNDKLKRFQTSTELKEIAAKKKTIDDAARAKQLAAEAAANLKFDTDMRAGKYIVRVGAIRLSQQSTFIPRSDTIVVDVGRGVKALKEINWKDEILAPTIYAFAAVENPTDHPLEVTVKLKAFFSDQEENFRIVKNQEQTASGSKVIGPRSVGSVPVHVDCKTASKWYPAFFGEEVPNGVGANNGITIGKVSYVRLTDVSTRVK